MIITLIITVIALCWAIWGLTIEIQKRQAAEKDFEVMRNDYYVALHAIRGRNMVIKKVSAQRDGAYLRIKQLMDDKDNDHGYK